MKFRDLSRKRDYIAICRGKLSISRFFAEKRRFRDLSRKIANIAISTPPRQTNAPDADSIFSIVVDQYKITFVNRSADFYQMHIAKYHIIYIEFSPCLTVFSLISCSCFEFSWNSQIACFNLSCRYQVNIRKTGRWM